MKKSTKGAVAAAAAGVLLLGGAGSLAYWTDDAAVTAGTLSSGSITLGDVECDGWLHTEDDSAVTKIVPGDEVYNDCDTTLTLVGDNIGATLEIDEASFPTGDLADEFDDPTVELQDSAGDPISSVDTEGATAVTAHIVVTFPYGTVSDPDPRTDASNDSQDGTAILDELTLIAVQTNTL